MFTRVLGILGNRRTQVGDCVPNVALYQAEPHLVIFSFLCRYGQICAQASEIGNFRARRTAKTVSVFKGFKRFEIF